MCPLPVIENVSAHEHRVVCANIALGPKGSTLSCTAGMFPSVWRMCQVLDRHLAGDKGPSPLSRDGKREGAGQAPWEVDVVWGLSQELELRDRILG